jgi:hypothetical protein
VSVRAAVGLLSCALLVAAGVAGSGAATPVDPSCGPGAYSRGYAYAGHRASARAHGIRATITATRAPAVRAGHVSGWVGVGGPGQGADGEDAWIQVGIAATHGRDEPFLYAEVARDGRTPRLVRLDDAVGVGERRELAVLEVPGRRGRWQVHVDGRPVTGPVSLRGSSGRWAPIVTAESWNGGRGSCNRFGFRFEDISVALAPGGAWRTFSPGYRFLDRGTALRSLTRRPYAFTASSWRT